MTDKDSIEMMAEALKDIITKAPSSGPLWIGSEEIIEGMKAHEAYEAEKDLLEKTQDWHQHGAVAPSCVGCPTAEVVIADGKYTRVITENLEKMADKLSVVKADLDQIEWAKLFMSDHWIITWAEALKIDVQIGLDAYREGSDNGTDRI